MKPGANGMSKIPTAEHFKFRYFDVSTILPNNATTGRGFVRMSYNSCTLSAWARPKNRKRIMYVDPVATRNRNGSANAPTAARGIVWNDLPKRVMQVRAADLPAAWWNFGLAMNNHAR